MTNERQGTPNVRRESRLELTPRELEVVRLIAEGLSSREVAFRLCRSPRTIENHLRSVYQKFDVRNRVAMVRVATEHGLLDAPPNDAVSLPVSELELKGHTLDLLHALDRRIARAAHSRYIPELALALTVVLGVRWAGLTEPTLRHDVLAVTCVAEHGGLTSQTECLASVSPYGTTMRDGEVVVADGLASRFPDWDLGRELGATAFVGVRMDDHFGRPIGTLWIMDSEPMKHPAEFLQILRLFRGRTGAELALAQLADRLGEPGAVITGEDIAAPSGVPLEVPRSG